MLVKVFTHVYILFTCYEVTKKTLFFAALSRDQIESKKLEWNVTSRVGSLDNARHKAGGGEKKVC